MIDSAIELAESTFDRLLESTQKITFEYKKFQGAVYSTSTGKSTNAYSAQSNIEGFSTDIFVGEKPMSDKDGIALFQYKKGSLIVKQADMPSFFTMNDVFRDRIVISDYECRVVGVNKAVNFLKIFYEL